MRFDLQAKPAVSPIAAAARMITELTSVFIRSMLLPCHSSFVTQYSSLHSFLSSACFLNCGDQLRLGIRSERSSLDPLPRGGWVSRGHDLQCFSCGAEAAGSVADADGPVPGLAWEC